MRYFLLFGLLIGTFVLLQAQSWNMLGGGNERNNLSRHYGLKEVLEPFWVVNNASFTGFGGNIYSFGDRFVATRWNLSTGSSIVECRRLQTGELLWVSPNFGPNSKLHVTAFNEDAVYVHDYDDNIRRYYALDPIDGQVKWSYPSYTFGPLDSPIFDCERNPVINTSLDEFNNNASLLRSVDKHTGATRWILREFVVLLPNKVKTAYGQKLYMIAGSSVDPKRFVAVDLSDGEVLYYSDPIPGQASQNTAPFAGPDGTLYVFRDGGDLFAFEDTGFGFVMKWRHTPQNVSHGQSPAVEIDGNILYIDNGQVRRVSRVDGQTLAVSSINNLPLGSSLLATRDSLIHLSNGGNAYLTLSYDLQTVVWTVNNTGNNTYAFPNLSKEGTMVMAGNGTTLSAYRNGQPHPPVADFLASSYSTQAGGILHFSDFSSYAPNYWQWSFEGGIPSSSLEPNPSVQYPEPGVYSIALIVRNDLGADTLIKNCYIQVDQTTSIKSNYVADAQSIRVYPNPFVHELFIEGSPIKEGDRLQILNALGTPIYEAIVDRIPYRLDLSGWPASLYWVRLGQHLSRVYKIQ